MKRLVLGAVLITVLVLFFPLISVCLADEGNFEKAGQAALVEREGTLFQKKAELEQFMEEAAVDSVISPDEIIAFRDRVESFNQLKKRFDEELAIYGERTSITLEEDYDLAISVYFGIGVFKGNYASERDPVRKVFARVTAKDVMVDKISLIEKGEIILLILSFVFLVLGITLAVRTRNGMWFLLLYLTVLCLIFFFVL